MTGCSTVPNNRCKEIHHKNGYVWFAQELLSLYKMEQFAVTYLKNSTCGKTQKLKLWQNSKSQIAKNKNEKLKFVTKLKTLNIDKTQKPNLWQNLKNSNCDKTQNPNLWHNSKTQLVTKLKKFICDKTQKI